MTFLVGSLSSCTVKHTERPRHFSMSSNNGTPVLVTPFSKATASASGVESAVGDETEGDCSCLCEMPLRGHNVRGAVIAANIPAVDRFVYGHEPMSESVHRSNCQLLAGSPDCKVSL